MTCLREPGEEEALEADGLSLFPLEDASQSLTTPAWQASRDVAPAAGASLWPDTLPVWTPTPELRAMVSAKEIILERAPVDTHPRAARSFEAPTEDRRPLASPLASEIRLLTETLERQRQAIDHGVIGASRVTDLLTTLETRINTFTNVAQTVADLEQRAVEASTDLEQRVGEFESQRRRIERALSEAARLVDAVSALEQRLSDLTESSVLERPADSQEVGQKAEETEFQPIRRAMVTARKALPTRAAYRDAAAGWVRERRRALSIGAAAASLLVLGAVAPWRYIPGHGSSVAHPETSLTSPTPAKGESRLGDDSVSDAGLPDSQKSPTVKASRLAQLPAEHARDSAVAADAAGSRRPVPRVVGAATTRESSSEESGQGVPRHNFTGDLTIESEPERATVFINQKRVGETPVHLKALRAGSLAVRIERDGYERWTAGVLVAAERQTHVSAKLERTR